MISIITATRNILEAGRRESLIRCVQSVSRLQIAHEHIIVDGLSTDGTSALLHELALLHKAVRIISEADSGIYEAFNKGIRASKGKWVYFIGSDDYLFSHETFEAVVDVAEKADVEMVISPVRYSNGWHGVDRRMIFRYFLTIKSYCHQGVVMRRNLLIRMGMFDERMRIASDFKLCLLAHLSNVKHLVVWTPYAEFSIGSGISSVQLECEHSERVQVPSEIFGLTDNERDVLSQRQLLPWRVLCPLAFHRNNVIRIAARHALKRRVANFFGILDEHGSPRNFLLGLLRFWET